jgi:Uma2 family endonuclease
VRSQSGSLEVVATLVRDLAPVEFERLLERRRRLGQGVLDEVWEGVHHMNPAPAGRHADIAQQLAELLGSPARKAGLVPMLSIFNLGEPDDYRVPDGGLHRERENHVYYPTVAMAVEIVSPDDGTWDKLGFYASRGVDELLIVEPQDRHVHWLALGPLANPARWRPAD